MADSQAGFSFSQEITNSLSQAAINTTADSTWNQSFSRNSYDEQLPPPRQYAPIARKYNVPAWTRELLKTSEDTEKLKAHDHIVKRVSEDSAFLRENLQQMNKSLVDVKMSISKMISEATNYMHQNLEKNMASFKDDILKAVDERMARVESTKQEELFDMFTELKEIKSLVNEIQKQDDLKNIIQRVQAQSPIMKRLKSKDDFRVPETRPTLASTPKKQPYPEMPMPCNRRKRRRLMPELTLDDFEIEE